MTQARKTAAYRVITVSGGSGAGLHNTFRPVSRGPGTKTRRTTNSFDKGGRKNMRKRITSLLLTLVMLLSLVPAMGVTASAAEWTTVNSYEELQTAVKAKKEYIKLGRDIDTTNFHSTGSGLEVEDWLTFENQTCTLDLNGKTLTLMTRLLPMGVFLRVYDGSNLTIKDSSSAKTGAITGAFKNYIASDAGCCLFHVHGGSSLTLENGSFTVTSEPHESNADTVRAMDSNITIKEGVTISHPGKFYPEHSYKDLDGNSYALRTDGKCKVIIDGGVFDGHVKLSGYQDTNGSIQINKGTFKKDVQVLYEAEENNSDPAVTVNGGTFEGNVYLQYWPWKTSLYMPYRLNGGTFKGTVNLHADDDIYEKDKPEGNPNIALGLDKCFGYSAVVTPDGTFVGPNAYTAVILEKLDHFTNKCYKMLLQGTASNPVRIIPNAWGMKSVTLDGDEINYAKDWKGTVERMDNSTAHTLKFEWYPLAQELKDAGYTYRANFDCYTVGSNTPTTSVPISATATEYSHTIPAGAAPSVYPFDLQLNLDKNGSSVGIMVNQHIVKLVVSEAPPAPPAPVPHSITITNTHGTATPTTTIAGETVTVKADDRTGYSQMFTQWYTKTAGVTFADVTKQETTFVMPDCDVQVYPGYQYVSFTKQPIPQISLEKGYGGKTSFAFSWDISKWELVDTATNQTVSSGDTPVKAGTLTDVTIPENTDLGSKTYRIVVTTANGEQFKSNDFIVTWFETMPAPLVEFSIPSDTKFIGEMTVNVGCPSTLETGGASPFETCYTTNGVDPKDADPSDIQRYYGYTDVTLTKTTHFMARTILEVEGGSAATWGELCEATYTMIDKLDAPTVTPTSCSYSGSLPIIVTIQDVYNAEIDYSVKQHDGYLSGGDEPGPMLETGLPDTFCGTTTFSAKAIVYKDGGGAWESDEVTYTYTREYWANISNATISGKVNEAIAATDVTITLDGEKFKDVAVGDDVSGWFNLPAGLTAKVKEQASYSRELVITISGTPTATSAAAITVTIPKDKLLANGTVDLTVLSNPKAVYNIGTDVAHTHDYTGQPYLYLDPGNHYQECKAGDGGLNIEAHTFGNWMPNSDGTTQSRICTKCKHTETASISMYSVTVSTDGNGTAMADKTSAAAGTVITLTAKADAGYTFKQWQVVTGGVTIKDNKFAMPAGNVEIKAIFEKNATPPPAPTVNPFVDVPAGSFYYDAVLWAVEKGVTTGTSATTFEPDGSCTRAQAVTFLWRVAGCPAPKSAAMPFTDVKAGSFYYDAVLWAVENGITKGTSETTFEPEAYCTRAQIVTLIWRAQKSPAAGTDNPFNDVKAGSFYETAVLWAVKAGVTKGTSATTFEPEGICTRAQIVTFIWRCMK